ncbi:hypothetical protein, partial [Streptomyces sp. EKS3.2]|uniref:hypothetical protein n=1 Tax=Streptomyces sp. EKS3.2 TaxID=3461008 RepID=UPI0040431CF1
MAAMVGLVWLLLPLSLPGLGLAAGLAVSAATCTRFRPAMADIQAQESSVLVDEVPPDRGMRHQYRDLPV